MGAYLDRLNSQYDEIRTGIDALVNRAADDNRDVTDAEQQQVDRDQSRLTELRGAIEHYTQLETDGAQVADLRSKVRQAPTVVRSSGTGEEKAYDITSDFPDAGSYAIALHRAMVQKDPAAIEKIERATQHQKLADNPGLIPKPVLGPITNLIDSTRPFISSIQQRPLPAGKFDRPYIDQHVAVAKQAAEKDLTASQKLTVLAKEVSASTYAGHLNISRQDVKWTSPGILQIVFDDFATVYAITTCADACAQFQASLTRVPVAIPDSTGEAITGALYEGAADALIVGAGPQDTLWCAPDVWAALGGSFNAMGAQSFPGMSLGSQSGSPLGLRLVVDQHFPAGFMVAGPSRLLEWYEDVDGLMQVGEPDVIGQLVGYAGYAAFLNVEPEAFQPYTLPPGAVTSRQSSDSDSSKSDSKR
jgi:hypothetical protein